MNKDDNLDQIINNNPVFNTGNDRINNSRIKQIRNTIISFEKEDFMRNNHNHNHNNNRYNNNNSNNNNNNRYGPNYNNNYNYNSNNYNRINKKRTYSDEPILIINRIIIK